MSTKSTKTEGKSSATASPDERSGHTSESWQKPVNIAQPNPPAGNENTNVMTAQETSDLLARLQDILFLWSGSDNKIIGRYVMTALPIPEGVDIGKLAVSSKSHDGHDMVYKVFCVNGRPVTE